MSKSNPLRADPTRTATLRRVFVSQVTKRFRRFRTELAKLVEKEDAFGLKRKRGLATNNRYAFMTNPQKVEAFRLWLARQTQFILIGADAQQIEQAFWTQYVEEGYRKGAGRAFDSVRKASLHTKPGQGVSDFYEGSRQEFLRQSFALPETVEKVQLLAGRVLTDLKGITEAMNTQIVRTLSDGLVKGDNPRTIGEALYRSVDKIGVHRAQTMARTEIVRAHAEGTLDSLERLGVQEIGVAVEWSAAGDDRVCPLCASLNGIVMSLKEARGTIPRHPNCRCAYEPANVGEDRRRQIRDAVEIRKRINKSIAAEIPKKSKRTVAQQKKRTTWVGADRKISKSRPKSIV